MNLSDELIDLFETNYIECDANNNLSNVNDELVKKLKESGMITKIGHLIILEQIINMYNIKYPEYSSQIINKFFN